MRPRSPVALRHRAFKPAPDITLQQAVIGAIELLKTDWAIAHP